MFVKNDTSAVMTYAPYETNETHSDMDMDMDMGMGMGNSTTTMDSTSTMNSTVMPDMNSTLNSNTTQCEFKVAKTPALLSLPFEWGLKALLWEL